MTKNGVLETASVQLAAAPNAIGVQLHAICASRTTSRAQKMQASTWSCTSQYLFYIRNNSTTSPHEAEFRLYLLPDHTSFGCGRCNVGLAEMSMPIGLLFLRVPCLTRQSRLLTPIHVESAARWSSGPILSHHV